MKRKNLKILLLLFTMMFILTGCSYEIKAESPETFVKEVLQSKNLKKFYANIVDGEKILDDMSDEEKENAETKLKLFRETIENDKDNIEFSVLDKNQGDYIRVASYNKGIDIKKEDKIDIFYVKEVDDKYKLDINISGFTQENLYNYQTEKKTNEINVHVYAKLSEEYKYEFKDVKDEYYALDLSTSYTPTIFKGYIKKDSTKGKEIAEKLKDGEVKQMTISVIQPDWKEQGRDLYLVTDIKSYNWVYNEQK